MRKLVLLTAFFATCTSWAQITESVVNKEKFENSGFSFKGKRVLMVDNISASKEENYFVFSKNARDEAQDRLYIEQFTKVDGKWELKVTDEIAESGVVTSTWGSRKAFSDVDKDGKADVILVYSKHPKGDMDTQLSVVQVLFYKHQMYWISSDAASNYTKDTFSNNFKDLPEALKEFALSFWERLDKA